MFHGSDAKLNTVISTEAVVVQPQDSLSVPAKTVASTLMAADPFDHPVSFAVIRSCSILCRLFDWFHFWPRIGSIIPLAGHPHFGVLVYIRCHLFFLLSFSSLKSFFPFHHRTVVVIFPAVTRFFSFYTFFPFRFPCIIFVE